MGRRQPVSRGTRGVQRAVAGLVEGVGHLVARLPPRVGDRLGAALGEVAYRLLVGRRRVALANLTLAFGPELDARGRRALARANFRHLGVTAIECCRLFFGSSGEMLARVRVKGMEHVKTAMAEGRGAFYLTAHYGNWELLAAAHGLAGFPASVVIRPLDNPFLEARLARGRTRSRLGLIPKREAVRGVRAALTRAECVGILLDQDAGRGGVFVPFFGQPAATSRSLAVLALKTRSPVVPAFIRRLPNGEHHITLEPVIPLVSTGQRERDVEAATARFTEAIERQVRAHPEQWFWVHRRWKTRRSV